MHEAGGARTRFNTLYVFDDGWDPPYEVVEEIEYRIAESRLGAYKEVTMQNREHKGGWLTEEVARIYSARSWIYRVANGNQYVGKVKEIGDELRESYGVTELEAINILSGKNVSDYVSKYSRIKNLIPKTVDPQKICDEVVTEYSMAM